MKTVADLTRHVRGARSSLRTVRGRATLLSMGVVIVGLLIALSTVLLVYRSQLRTSLDQTLEQQVADRARLLDQGNPPDSLTTVLQEEAMVWIGSNDGVSFAIGGAIFPIDNPVPSEIGQTVTKDLLVEERKPDEVEREVMRLRIASRQTSDGSTVVLAGSETEEMDAQVTRLAMLFLGALPILTALVGAVTWIVGGRVLAPVEKIRSRAAEISGADLGARVPVPSTADEIEQLAVTMNSMLDRIETHDRALHDFTADASHELKSPIANLRTLLDTTELDDPEWASIRERLLSEGDRLRDLVDNLLFLASRQPGDARPGPGLIERTAIDLDDLVFREAELLAATKRVAVDLTDVEPVVLHGRRSDIVRLLRNLVDNGARHANGRVTFTTSTDAGEIVLTVADDGPGIAVDDRDRVFERFTRLDESRARDDGGTGLGLAIVEQITSDHGGTIAVNDAPSGGALFTVRFPA